MNMITLYLTKKLVCNSTQSNYFSFSYDRLNPLTTRDATKEWLKLKFKKGQNLEKDQSLETDITKRLNFTVQQDEGVESSNQILDMLKPFFSDMENLESKLRDEDDSDFSRDRLLNLKRNLYGYNKSNNHH